MHFPTSRGSYDRVAAEPTTVVRVLEVYADSAARYTCRNRLFVLQRCCHLVLHAPDLVIGLAAELKA